MDATTERYINRELSWLEFNQRVLDEAWEAEVPPLERLKFLAITGSNLDEFFMVRVGGLKWLAAQGSAKRDPSGRAPSEQLEAIGRRCHQMAVDQYACYLEELEPELAEQGIKRVRTADLSRKQAKVVEQLFEAETYPVLTPMAVSLEAEFPLLVNQTLNVIVRLAPGDDSEEKPEGESDSESGEPAPRFAVIPFGLATHRFITLPSEGGYEYVLLEDVVAAHIEAFFPGETIEECVPFRITRNADLSVNDDRAADLLLEMERVLDARKQSGCVRLELSQGASEETRGFLCEALHVGEDDVYAASGPLGLASFMRLTDVQGFDDLRYPDWPPRPSPQVDPTVSMFDLLARQDVLLCHPYERFEPVVRLIEEAADDPDVLAIKQILYRTSRDSSIVAALLRAAESGKQVTVIVELKARFDEARNIGWAKDLEQAGVQVIYGIKGLKTHAKVCIIIRREPHGIQRYVHFGTGNYNETTARLYTDISYMTSNEDLGADATSFFNAITGYSQPQAFRKIESAPIGLRERLLELIETETERVRHGQPGHIMAKMNSLVDPKIIDALYKASAAGVKVELNIRGICCLRAGVPGLSENISVISIIDRYLEHSRIFYFHHGGDQAVFIASADWMPRNLDRRVELLVPVEDPASADRLIGIVKTCLQDNVKGRRLLPDGQYERLQPGPRALRSQEELYREACDAEKQAEQSQRTVFIPQRASQTEAPQNAHPKTVQRIKMKTLLLLRHAKSSWKEPGLVDHERPLNKRGRRDAPRMGQLLRREGLTPDLIVSSTAERAQKTALLVAKECGYDHDVQLTDDLYLAAPTAYVDVLRRLPETHDRVMVVGHNPGLEELLEALTETDEPLPTGALAQVSLNINRWQDLKLEMDGQLLHLWRPRELDGEE